MPLSDAAVVGRSVDEIVGHSCILIRKMGGGGVEGAGRLQISQWCE